MSNKELKSECCDSYVTLGGYSRKGTHYYICSKCKQSCDAHVISGVEQMLEKGTVGSDKGNYYCKRSPIRTRSIKRKYYSEEQVRVDVGILLALIRGLTNINAQTYRIEDIEVVRNQDKIVEGIMNKYNLTNQNEEMDN